MNTDNQPVVKASMLIRKPIEEVFEALVNPDITSNFWFTKSSGRVEAGKTIEWEWGQFDAKDTVDILEVKKDDFISFQWKVGELKTTIDITFSPKTDGTFVTVTEKGFWKEHPKDEPELVERIGQMLGQNGGWNLVLCAMKAWLEHDLDLNLIADHNIK